MDLNKKKEILRTHPRNTTHYHKIIELNFFPHATYEDIYIRAL